MTCVTTRGASPGLSTNIYLPPCQSLKTELRAIAVLARLEVLELLLLGGGLIGGGDALLDLVVGGGAIDGALLPPLVIDVEVVEAGVAALVLHEVHQCVEFRAAGVLVLAHRLELPLELRDLLPDVLDLRAVVLLRGLEALELLLQ